MDNVRTRLGDGLRAQAPGDAQLLQQVCSQTRTLLRAKRNVGNPWDFADTSIVVTPQVSTYSIGVPDFGIPLAVITVNDFANANFVVRRIPFYTSQDLPYDWGLPENAGFWPAFGSPYDTNHTALRCAITWRANIPTIEFQPIPVYAGTYLIRYLQSASGVDQMAVTQEPVPAEDCDLIEIRSAQSLLALAEWYDPMAQGGRAANAEKRKDLFVTLANDQQLAKQQFDLANRITTGPQVHTRYDMTTI